MGRRPWLYWLALTAGLTALTLRWFASALPTFAQKLISDDPDALHALGILRLQWQHFLHGHFLDGPTLWPYPHALVGEDGMLLPALLSAPVAALSTDVAAYNTVLLGSFVLAGLAAALLVHAVSGSRALGAWAALAWAFVPRRLETLQHLNVLYVFPAALWAWGFVRWRQSGRARWLGVAVLAAWLQFLASAQIFTHLALSAAAWLALEAWRARRSWRLLPWRALLAAAAASAVLLLPWIVAHGPARSLVEIPRADVDALVGYSAKLRDYDGGAQRFGWPTSLGVSVAVLLVAGAALPRLRARWAWLAQADELWAPLAALGTLVVLSLGPVLYRQGEAWRLPMAYLGGLGPFGASRVPERMHRLAALWAVVAAAWVWSKLGGLLTARLRARGASWGGHVPWLLSTALCAATLSATPAANVRLGSLPDPSLQHALSELPESAVVGVWPLWLRPEERAAIDFAAVGAQRRLLGGYSAVIPSLFWQLRWRSDALWDGRAQGIWRAAGLTHLLVHRPSLAASLRQAVQDSAPPRRDLDAPWELWDLGASEPPRLIALLPGETGLPAASTKILGPAEVGAGAPVTLELTAAVPESRLDLLARRQCSLELAGPEGVQSAAAELWSPGVLEPDGRGYLLRFVAPSRPGSYALRGPWLPAAEAFALTVSNRESTAGHGVDGELTLSAPATAAHSRKVVLHGSVRNRDHWTWLATPAGEIPKDAGALVFHAFWHQGVQRLPVQIHGTVPYRGLALPYDLAPGQSATFELFVDAPPQSGIFNLEVTAQAAGGSGPGLVAMAGPVLVD